MLYISLSGPQCKTKSKLTSQLSDILQHDFKVYKLFVDNIFPLDQTIQAFIKEEERVLNKDYDIVLSNVSIHDFFVQALLTLTPIEYEAFRSNFKDVSKHYDILIYCELCDNLKSGELGLYQTLVKPYAKYVLDYDKYWKNMRYLLNIMDSLLEDGR